MSSSSHIYSWKEKSFEFLPGNEGMNGSSSFTWELISNMISSVERNWQVKHFILIPDKGKKLKKEDVFDFAVIVMHYVTAKMFRVNWSRLNLILVMGKNFYLWAKFFLWKSPSISCTLCDKACVWSKIIPLAYHKYWGRRNNSFNELSQNMTSLLRIPLIANFFSPIEKIIFENSSFL